MHVVERGATWYYNSSIDDGRPIEDGSYNCSPAPDSKVFLRMKDPKSLYLTGDVDVDGLSSRVEHDRLLTELDPAPPHAFCRRWPT